MSRTYNEFTPVLSCSRDFSRDVDAIATGDAAYAMTASQVSAPGRSGCRVITAIERSERR